MSIAVIAAGCGKDEDLGYLTSLEQVKTGLVGIWERVAGEGNRCFMLEEKIEYLTGGRVYAHFEGQCYEGGGWSVFDEGNKFVLSESGCKTIITKLTSTTLRLEHIETGAWVERKRVAE